MALLRTRNISLFCNKNHSILWSITRNHWTKDYKPEPYPKTAEERLASAQKYGILPEEYVPYPDDGTHYGDYPKLPNISGEAKDPFYQWDNPELKRNFNEPLHVDADLMGEDRYDVSFRHRTSVFMQFVQFFGVMSGTFGIFYFLERMKMFPGLVPKQYPFQGETHYSFKSNC